MSGRTLVAKRGLGERVFRNPLLVDLNDKTMICDCPSSDLLAL